MQVYLHVILISKVTILSYNMSQITCILKLYFFIFNFSAIHVRFFIWFFTHISYLNGKDGLNIKGIDPNHLFIQWLKRRKRMVDACGGCGCNFHIFYCGQNNQVYFLKKRKIYIMLHNFYANKCLSYLYIIQFIKKYFIKT